MAILLGTEKQIDSSVFTDFNAVVRLTDSTAIVVYRDGTTTNDIIAVHMTLASGVITIGALEDTLIVATSFVSITRLSDTSALLFSRSGTVGKTVVLTVSGTTITTNTIKNLTDASITDGNIVTLTSTKVLIVYSNSASDGIARVLTISGTTITENAAFTYITGTSVDNQLVVLTATKAVVTYSDTSGTSGPTGEVLDISGSTITGNTAYELNAAVPDPSNDRNAAIALSSTKYIYIFQNQSDNKLDGLIVDESATVLTFGSLQEIEATELSQTIAIGALDSTSAMLISDLSSNSDKRFYHLTISGTTITVAATTDVAASDNNGTGLDALNSTEAIGSWSDQTIEEIAAISASLGFSGYDLVLGGGQT